jgi:hypothetical protein
MTQFQSQPDLALCHLAHVHAMEDAAPFAVSAYRKRDRDLRKHARFKAKHKPSGSEVDLIAGLTTLPMEMADEAWFTRRWELGEEHAVAMASRKIAGQAESLGTFGLTLEDEVNITASAAIRWGVAVGPKLLVSIAGSGYHALLSCIASSLRPLLALPTLSGFDRHVLELHVAATVLISIPAFETHIDPLLAGIGRDLLPKPGSEAIARTQLARLAELALEQAHGEVERIASGMHQGRTDRLHRAWLRGFFIPKGLTLEHLVGALA